MAVVHSRMPSASELAGLSVLSHWAPSPLLTVAPCRPPPRKPLCPASFRSSLLSVDDVVGEDVMRAFLKERQVNGDAISKASDMLWKWGASSIVDSAEDDVPTSVGDLDDMEEENVGGYLKLAKTKEWVMGETTAPLNKKLAARDWLNESEKRKKINIMRYEALKRELIFLTGGVGAACSGYCLIAFSFEAAISYAFGVILSCVYLQLLSSHVDSLSKESVPPIFMQKKSRKIGIRSEDLQQSVERVFCGTGIALSSPRLVIPATIYGLWALSNHFSSDYFHIQLVPAMFGLFAYKAAALIQVYRDNEDLKLVFPDNSDGSPR